MTEQRRDDFTNFSQERVDFLPTEKTIPPELDERAARVTALSMLQAINRVPNIEVGTFQTNTGQG